VTRVPVRRRRLGMISATDIDPSPGVPHANGAAYRGSSVQVKTPHRPTSMRVTPHENRRSPALGASAARTARGAERSKPPHRIKTVDAPVLLDGAHAPTDAELPKTTRGLVARRARSRVTIARDRTGVVLRQRFRRVALRTREPDRVAHETELPLECARCRGRTGHRAPRPGGARRAPSGEWLCSRGEFMRRHRSNVPLYQTSVPFTSMLFNT
jgi:hypothetical protein